MGVALSLRGCGRWSLPSAGGKTARLQTGVRERLRRGDDGCQRKKYRGLSPQYPVTAFVRTTEDWVKTNYLSPSPRPAGLGTCFQSPAACRRVARDAASGSVMRKVVPRPGALSTAMWPECSCTMP